MTEKRSLIGEDAVRRLVEGFTKEQEVGKAEYLEVDGEQVTIFVARGFWAEALSRFLAKALEDQGPKGQA